MRFEGPFKTQYPNSGFATSVLILQYGFLLIIYSDSDSEYLIIVV